MSKDIMKLENRKQFREGVRDGMPIALGYFAVAFSLGIMAKNVGLTAFQGLLASFLNNASAGEYAGFTLIAADAPYWEMAVVTFITNMRYLLMSCALSQKFSPDTPLIHRFLVGYDVTDEIFGITIARPGYLNPVYAYGAILVAIPGWALGTYFGVVAGNILPATVVSALSVALYGMFLAIIIPPAKKNKVVAVLIVICFVASYIFTKADIFAGISSGTKTIILTLLIAGGAALFFPVKEEEEGECAHES